MLPRPRVCPPSALPRVILLGLSPAPPRSQKMCAQDQQVMSPALLRSFPPPLSRGVNSSGHPVCHRESGSAEQSRGLGLLPLPLAGEGWGGGERTRSVFLCAPSLSLPRKRGRGRRSRSRSV